MNRSSFEDRAKRYLARVRSPRDYYNCFDCFSPFTVYIVHDHVWNQAWPNHEEDGKTFEQIQRSMGGAEKTRCLLCLSCLQERLKRDLKIGDFEIGPPCNTNILFAYTMGKSSRD